MKQLPTFSLGTPAVAVCVFSEKINNARLRTCHLITLQRCILNEGHLLRARESIDTMYHKTQKLDFDWDMSFSYQTGATVLAVFNSLTSGRSACNFKHAICHLILLIDIFRSCYNNTLRWMSLDLTYEKSTLVQVRQQAISWDIAGPDLCRHIASPCHN